MTSEQIKVLKETYMTEATKPNGNPGTLGEYMRFLLDGGIDFVTSKDFVVFDDSNELLHCICVNDQAVSQADFPVKVISSEYAMVQQVETIMSRKNFEDFLNSGYISGMISNEKKEFMLKWSQENIRNQALQPMDPEPAYKDNTKVIPMHATKLEREDYVSSSAYAVVEGERIFFSSIAEAVNNIEDGAVLYISSNAAIPETVALEEDKNITIDLGGNSLVMTDAKPLFNVTNGVLNIINSGNIKGSIISKGDVISVTAVDTGKIPIVNIGGGVNVESGECCIYAKGTATVNCSGTLTSTSEKYAAIQGNGNANSAGTIINLTGASIENTNNIGIYFPQNGELNIDNCTITGTTGLYVKSGKVNVTKSEIYSTGEAVPYNFNGNGGDSTGDAVVLDFCDYPGDNPTAEFTSTKLTSKNAKALAVYDKEGNINPDVAADAVVLNENVFVSDVACAKYCAENVKLVYHSTVFGKDYFNTTEATPGFVIDTGDGSTIEVDSLEKAFEEAFEDCTITVKNDEVIAKTVNFDKGISVNIDLNGNTLYSEEKTVFNITGGAVNLTGSGIIKADGICFRVNGKSAESKLIVGEDIVLESATSTPIYPAGNAIVEISGVVTSKTNYGAIQGNGSKGNEGTKIIINDGATLSSEDIAIYHPQAGELEINGGTIIGSTAIYIKAGSLKVSGDPIIRATGPANEYKFNGNGCDSTGDALIVDFCDYPGGMPTVEIAGGTFKSENAKAIECYDREGNINPEIAKTNVNISGGLFTSAPNADYFADGYKAYHDNKTNLYSAVKA